MLSHSFLGTNDVEKARRFYNKVLGALGLEGHELPHGTAYSDGKASFIVAKPLNGEAATASNGHTLGFNAKSYSEVDEFHRAGLEAGGTSEGEPGVRQNHPAKAYGAYLRDPDGHKICAFAPNAGEG